jgi:hypothetical protein
MSTAQQKDSTPSDHDIENPLVMKSLFLDPPVFAFQLDTQSWVEFYFRSSQGFSCSSMMDNYSVLYTAQQKDSTPSDHDIENPLVMKSLFLDPPVFLEKSAQ